jgi:O-antigen/teichoic acid export membrane protein
MRSIIQRAYTNPNFVKAFDWGKLITITGGAQVIVQAVSLIGGILVIRLLPTQEYAFYTLANTMLGTMTVLADGGISAGVMAQGGKVWQDKKKLGVVIVTGLNLRKKFAAGSFIVSTPILAYLLLHHGASWFTSTLIILSIVPAFWATLSDTILTVAPKLKQDIKPLQLNQAKVGLGRLALLGLTIFVFPWTFIAVLSGGIPRVWGNFRLRKISADYVDLKQVPDSKVNKKLLASVKSILPGSIYYCISGQITIWLISIFGTTTGLAQLGALGRLTMVLTIINSLFWTLVVPRFARLEMNPKLLMSRFLQIQLVLCIISIFIVSFVALYTDQVLWVLGKGYSNLKIEVILMTISSCVGLMSGITYSLSVTRGWILSPVANIAINLLTQLALVLILDLSNIKGVILFSIINSIVTFIMLSLYFLYRTRSSKRDDV